MVTAATSPEAEKLLLIVAALNKFFTHAGGRVFTLNQPVTLSVKGRMSTSVYESRPFVGDEQLRVKYAYFESNRVWLACSMATPDPKMAFVRIEYSRAMVLLKEFVLTFEEWQQANDDRENAELHRDVERLEREARHVDMGGGNPDFATW